MECSGGAPSYYGVLGLNTDASDEQVRRAYRKLAKQWHPDKWSRSPSLLGKAKRKFQQIQEAYSVLSDGKKKALYDAGLYDPHGEDEEVEGFADFVQEMVSLMNDAKKKAKTYSLKDLQSMFWDMARSFEAPEWDNPVQERSMIWEMPQGFGLPQSYPYGEQQVPAYGRPWSFDSSHGLFLGPKLQEEVRGKQTWYRESTINT